MCQYPGRKARNTLMSIPANRSDDEVPETKAADDQLAAQAHERGAWLLSKPFDAAVLGEVLERAAIAPRLAS